MAAPPDGEPDQDHLSTDHLLGDLKNRTISGAFVTIGAQIAQFFLNLASIMVLARLLSPGDFGLFAMVMTIVGYLRLFKDAGLSVATVQRERITQAQVSNLFWINVVISGSMGLILAASAPLVASFYREPRLVPITVILSSTFVLSGLVVQHTALLNRQMRFKAVAVIQLASMTIGVVVGVAMAWLDYGYWSLVVSNVVTVAVVVPLTWIAVRWIPERPARQSGTRPLISFGASMAGGGLIYSVARGADSMLIGRFYGADALGLYTRAAALLQRPLEQFMSPISSVFVPVLSRIQGDPERYRRTFLQVYEALAIVSFVSTGLLFALARPITLVVLGPQWEAAVIIFAAFTVAAVCVPLATASTWLFASQGRGRDSLIATSLISGITLCSFVAGLPFGPAGVAIFASTASLVIGMPTLFHFAGRVGPVSAFDLWSTLFRYVPLWAVTVGTTYLMRLLVADTAPLVQIFIGTSAGLISGGVLIWAIAPMRQAALALISIARELKSKPL